MFARVVLWFLPSGWVSGAGIVPLSSSGADRGRELCANAHAAGKRCFLGAERDLVHSAQLCAQIQIFPPIGKGNGLSLRDCYWTKGPHLNPAEGGKDPLALKALAVCRSADGEAGVHLSVLVVWAGWCWRCLCLPAGAALCGHTADQAVPAPWHHPRKRFSPEQQQELSVSPFTRLKKPPPAGRVCRQEAQCPPVLCLLAPAKGNTEQLTSPNKYLD